MRNRFSDRIEVTISSNEYRGPWRFNSIRIMIRLLPVVALVLAFQFAEARTNRWWDTLPKLIIVNTFDASSQSMRKSKRDLFRELADSLQVYLAQNIKEQFGIASTIVPGLVKADDSSVLSLLKSKGADAVIVIQALDVYFNEGNEKHVEEYGSSPKLQTDYNLCSKVDYTFHTVDSVLQKQVTHCDYFTTRSVNDKAFVIKFGPDIVGKKRHTSGAVERNAIDYIQSVSTYIQKPTNQ